MNIDIKLHKNDLPDDLHLGNVLAIDGEFMGLNIRRDPLCLIQISSGNSDAHIIQLDRSSYNAPNLKKILNDESVTKIFHYGRADMAHIKHYLKIDTNNILDTKIASKLARTYTDKHGYKELCRELLNETISKIEQSSDWGGTLSKEQKEYAASDVLHLHKLKKKLDAILERENRINLANACFEFIAHRTDLDLYGWQDVDIFKH